MTEDPARPDATAEGDGPAPAAGASEAREAGRRPTLIRGAVALLFLVAVEVATTVVALIAVVQVVWSLSTGGRNAYLSRFGMSLALWIAQATAFVTAASDERPFPWTEWPTDEK